MALFAVISRFQVMKMSAQQGDMENLLVIDGHLPQTVLIILVMGRQSAGLDMTCCDKQKNGLTKARPRIFMYEGVE